MIAVKCMESLCRWSLGLCLVLLLIGPWGSLAHADAAYDEAIRQGLAEFEAGHYPEALEIAMASPTTGPV